MTLTQFLSSHGIADAAFAESIGVSRQALHRYKRGERRPEWDVLERIVRVTEGAVTPNDFIELPERVLSAPNEAAIGGGA